MEVFFMAEKRTYIQIVDAQSGRIEKIVDFADLDAMSTEDKLALSRGKQLFIVTYRLEPIVKVEMKKTAISEPISFDKEEDVKPQEPVQHIEEEPAKTSPRKGKK